MASKFIIIVLLNLFLFSCTNKEGLIQNPQRLADIDRMLGVQKEMTSKSLLPVWDIFNRKLSPQEKQAMEFLYAYMPLSDLADYPPDFFLKNVQLSLQARREMPWGGSIPEEEFLHFVLPLRVNNENLDHFREVMYSQIKERIKGMEMKQAALEINHWCHREGELPGNRFKNQRPFEYDQKDFWPLRGRDYFHRFSHACCRDPRPAGIYPPLGTYG